MAYATPVDLAKWMGLGSEGFPSQAQTDRATMLLDAATGLIDDEIGQSLTLATDIGVVLPGSGTNLLVLPRWPVTAVTSLAVDGVALASPADYTWKASGLVTRVCGVWSCDELITVTSTAGWSPIPSSVKALSLELATGSWNNPGAKKSERIADYQVAWQRVGMSLSTKDIAALGRYASNR